MVRVGGVEHVNRGVPLLDLIQEGTLGLHHAVERFDRQKGTRLSTYATWLIRAAIQRAIARQARTVRVPADVLTKFSLIARAETAVMTTQQHTPTQAEVAAGAGMTWQEIDWVRLHTMPEVSLDAPIGGEDGPCLLDRIGVLSGSPYEACETSAGIDALRDAISRLTHRERRILDLRYGLTGGADHTLKQIGDTLGVTRERVRQIEEQALRKLEILINARLGPNPDSGLGAQVTEAGIRGVKDHTVSTVVITRIPHL